MVALLIGVFFLLMFLGVPIALALGMASLFYIVLQGYPLEVMIQRMFSMTQSFPLLAIPFFILLGQLVTYGGFVGRIIRFSKALIGHLTGALGLIMVVANMIFAGMSGSAVADTAALGSVLVPAMKREGYDAGFIAALNATAGTLGVIIPPSIPMVVFGWITEVSVGQLFLGGAIPGLIIGGLMFVYVWWVASRRGYPRTEGRASMSEIWAALKESILAVIMPLLIIISIVTGVATPTEVSVVGVAYAFVVGMFVYRELNWAKFLQALKDTVISTSVVMIVVCTSGLFSWLLSYERFGNTVADFILSLSRDPQVVLVIITLAMLVAGCFIDLVPNLLLFVPICSRW
ncbi:MAG TPA: TRAP transporter large permease [Firmicutes bacterium]|nr:TRAP transporter large permease [Bacillota bacterium]